MSHALPVMVIRGLFIVLLGLGIPMGAGTATAATYNLDANQSSLAYSFLPGWAMRTLSAEYATYLPPSNTGTASNHHMATFIQFDIAPLVSASVDPNSITSATLRLYALDPSSIGFGAGPSEEYPVDVDFRLLTGAWNQDTITWGNQPGGNYNPTTTAPPGDIIGSITGIDGHGFWVELDITEVLKDWLTDPNSNYGLRMTQSTAVRDATSTSIFPSFASQGHSNAAWHPDLVVTTAAVPEPGRAMLLLLAGTGLLCTRRRARA